MSVKTAFVKTMLAMLMLCLAGMCFQAGAQQATVPNRVIATHDLDLIAGMAGQNLYLAPDGEQFAQVNPDGVCIYGVDGTQERCIEFGEKVEHPDIERFRWSPDGRYLVFTENLLQILYEPDLWNIDMETGNLADITDDSVEGTFLFDDTEDGSIDLAPMWLGDGRVAFLRYEKASDDHRNISLRTMEPDGGESEVIAELGSEAGLPVYSFDISTDGRYFAYNWDRPDEGDDRAGLWLRDLQTDEVRQLFHAESRMRTPQMVAFSPDGQYVMWMDGQYMLPAPGEGEEYSPVRIVPVAGGDPILVNDEALVFAAWWSPEGAALAYLIRDRENPSVSGLYVTSAPGEPSERVLEGLFIPPNGRASVPVIWGANNTIILSRAPDEGVVVVELGS
jgi:Tol biopolymer transport system component